MPQTIDYKVNVDLNEAMSTLQMVDMQMAQMGGGYQPLPYHPGPVEQAFGDLSFSAGQFSRRFQQPLGTIQTFTPSSLSTMPHVNFATAATSVWNPSGLSVPHGIAAYDFQRHAQEQFAVQGGRAAAGFAWGAGKEIGLAGGSLALGAAASAVGTPLLGAAVGIGSYMLGSTVLEPVSGMLQDKAVIEDVVRHSSKLDRGSVHAVSNALTDLHLNDPLLTASDVTSIAGLGSQYGLMGDPASSSKEYLKNFRELASSAKEVATALGASLQEGMATMAQLKGAGFSTSGAAGVVGQLHGMAGGDPAGVRALIGTGMMGASAFHGTGMARTGGFWQAIGTSGAVGGAMGSGDVSKEMWHQAGGKSGVTRLMLGSNMQFQQSGLGVALQAGLWQGGTDMAAYGGGDMFGLMASGLGGMSSGDFLSFNRNRAEAVGKMGSRERMQMEAKTHMQMAEMMAGQMGGDVGDALFFMGQGQGMSTPQAQAWASSIQRISSGKFGGGGDKKAQMRARLVADADSRNAQFGVDAAVGRFRDRMGSWYNETFVEPIGVIQGHAEDWIADTVNKRSTKAVGDVDLTLMSMERGKDGRYLLEAQMDSMKGMDVSEYGFAGNLRDTLSAGGVESFSAPGAGRVKVADDTYYAHTDVYGLVGQAEAAADKAWGSGYDQLRNGRGGDSSRIYRSLQAQHFRSERSIRGVSDAFNQGGYGAALSFLGTDRTSASSLTASRALLADLGYEASRADIESYDVHNAMAVAAGGGRKLAGEELRSAIGMGDRGFGDVFVGEFSEKMGYGGSGPSDPDASVPLRMLQFATRTDSYVAEAWRNSEGDNILSRLWQGGVGLQKELGGRYLGLVGGAAASIPSLASAATSATGHDTERRKEYEAVGAEVFRYITEATSTPSQKDRDSAWNALTDTSKPGHVSEWTASEIVGGESQTVRRNRARDAAVTRLGSAEDAATFLKQIEGKSHEDLVAMKAKVGEWVQERGGPGKKPPGKKQAVVPIAMGIDATDRDLYNAVASLYRSVKTLETNIKKPKASDDGTGTG